MRMIELLAMSKSEPGCTCTEQQFDTIREATTWVKSWGLSRAHWVEHAESETFPDDIASLRLMVDGECHSEWFPCWAGEQDVLER